jgi:hypothetical protein
MIVHDIPAMTVYYTCQNIIIKEMEILEEHHKYHLNYIKIQQS